MEHYVQLVLDIRELKTPKLENKELKEPYHGINTFLLICQKQCLPGNLECLEVLLFQLTIVYIEQIVRSHPYQRGTSHPYSLSNTSYFPTEIIAPFPTLSYLLT